MSELAELQQVQHDVRQQVQLASALICDLGITVCWHEGFFDEAKECLFNKRPSGRARG